MSFGAWRTQILAKINVVELLIATCCGIGAQRNSLMRKNRSNCNCHAARAEIQTIEKKHVCLCSLCAPWKYIIMVTLALLSIPALCLEWKEHISAGYRHLPSFFVLPGSN